MPNYIRVCGINGLKQESILRIDHGDETYAIYHGPDGQFYATDGYCTHEAAHLSDGIVDGFEIECPLHFGAFDYRTGIPTVAPACVKLKTYPVEIKDETLFILIE